MYQRRLPWWLRGLSVCLQCRRPGFDPWVRKIPWRRKWQPTPVHLPGKSHGQRSLVDCSPWDHKESDMTERHHFHFHQRRQWQPTSVHLPGKYHGQRSLVGCSPWGLEGSDTTEWLHFHALEKEMAIHSSVLACRIPGTGEPGGLPSMGSHRVRHNWSDLAAAVAACHYTVISIPCFIHRFYFQHLKYYFRKYSWRLFITKLLLKLIVLIFFLYSSFILK